MFEAEQLVEATGYLCDELNLRQSDDVTKMIHFECDTLKKKSWTKVSNI